MQDKEEDAGGSVDSDGDDIEPRHKNRLVRVVGTRCGRWVDKALQGFEFIELKNYSRDNYNKHRHMALANGLIYDEKDIMNANEANLLK